MKAAFCKYAKKIELFAEQAVVVELSFNDTVTIKKTTKSSDEIDVNSKDYSAKKMQEEFLKYLETNNIVHSVVSQEQNVLVFALPRNESDNFEDASRVVKGFFKDGRQISLKQESYYQKSYDKLMNKLFTPFSRTRREVNRAIASFKL